MRKLKIHELNRKTNEEFKSANKIPLVIVLDNIRSMHNIGSVFRTSDAFLIQSVYLCGISAKPPNREIYKTALGAEETVDWVYFQSTIDAIKQLKENNYQIISIEQADNSTMLENFNISEEEKYVLVFGHEVKGVDQNIIDISDHCIEIPQEGTKHSLNISVSVGIVMWEFYKKLSNFK